MLPSLLPRLEDVLKGRRLQGLALAPSSLAESTFRSLRPAVLTTFFTDCLTAALVAALVAFFAVFAAAEEAFAVAFLAASFALVPASCATPLRMRAAVGVQMPAAVSPSRPAIRILGTVVKPAAGSFFALAAPTPGRSVRSLPLSFPAMSGSPRGG